VQAETLTRIPEAMMRRVETATHMVGPGVTINAGFVGVAVVLLASTAAALAYTGPAGEPYSPANHFVSELGELRESELAMVFNGGLMVGGIGLLLFVAGMAGARGGGLAMASVVVGGFGAVAGILVGVLPVDSGMPHLVFASVFFVLSSIAIGLFTLDIGLRPDDRFPFWLVAPGIATVTGSVAFVVYLAVAGPEALAPPIERPAILLITTLEWLTLIGILFWVGIVAARWRIALARSGRVS
jgi:hypothetical membrane protein